MPADLADVDLSPASGFGISDAVVPVPVPLRVCAANAPPFPLAGRGVGVFFSDLGSGPGIDDSPALPAGEGFCVGGLADLGFAAGADVRANLAAGLATVAAGTTAVVVGATA